MHNIFFSSNCQLTILLMFVEDLFFCFLHFPKRDLFLHNERLISPLLVTTVFKHFLLCIQCLKVKSYPCNRICNGLFFLFYFQFLLFFVCCRFSSSAGHKVKSITQHIFLYGCFLCCLYYLPHFKVMRTKLLKCFSPRISSCKDSNV